jgi:dihydrofolate reductase
MLPKRMVVVSRSLKTDQASVFPSLPEALEYSKKFSEDVFISGGQSVYKESIQYADYMYLSFIKGEHQGNVYFPEFDEGEWSIELKEEHDEFVFVIYKRK